MIIKSVVGQRFDRLTIMLELPRGTGIYVRRVVAKCDCGREKSFRLTHLRSRLIRSCGCLHSEVMTKRFTTHGLRKHPLYKVFAGMLTRCYNPKCKSYFRYGGRGIVICDEWRQDFKVFYNWAIESGWDSGLQIERKDNNSGYRPDNCCFVTRSKNCRNRRNNVIIEYNGEKKLLCEWAECLGVEIKTLWARIFQHRMSIEKALTMTAPSHPEKIVK